EEGLAVADAAGGDRFVETELYQLYERRRRMDSDREKRALQFGDPSLAPERPAPVVRREPERTAPAKPAAAGPPLSKEERLRALLSEEGFAGIDLQGLD